MSTFASPLLALAVIASLPAQASATPLPDGTPVRLRLINVITSETSTVGESLEFVVARDVVRDVEVLVRRRPRVIGTIVDVQRIRVGFFTRPGRLAFTFDQMTARDGQVVRLRASARPQSNGRIVVDRGSRHHRLKWADGADLFDAFVN